MTLYPIKFKPILKEKIWGGHKFDTLLEKECNPNSLNGESWEISDLDDNISIIANGFLAENDLRELIELYMGDVMGDSNFNKFGLGFPLLIKYIDAAQNLSIQVHPDDELAEKRYEQQGKNEFWYIMDAEPGAGIFLGFKSGFSRNDYVNAVKNDTIEQSLNFFPVQKGDAFFIPAGTVHAIGKGILLAEIQQSSDITYRIFDWNRLTSDGIPRELHCAEALDAIHFEDEIPSRIVYEEQWEKTTQLICTDYFKVNILAFEKPMQKIYMKIDSFVIYMCLEGEVHLFSDDFHEVIYKGETILVPAIIPEITLVPNGKSKILEVHL